MEKRCLGKTGIFVNPIGLGGIPIQRVCKEEGIKIIRMAIDKGVNFIDSARGYTVSENVIGEALVGLRNKVYLATKSMSRDYENMKKDIDISLHNFKTNYIDLYQLHNVKSKNEFEKVIDGAYIALQEAKKDGKIKHIGITSHSKDFLFWLINSEYCDMFETIQFPYNFIESEASELFELAHKHNLGTIAMKPLGGGTIDNGVVAIKYLLNDSNLSIAIPGMGSFDDVNSNLSITNIVLNEKDIEYISQLKSELKGNFCHRCGYCLPCTKGIDIPTMFTFERYYTRYGLKEWASERYFNSAVLPNVCIDCQVCVKRCPYNLDIPKKLKEIVKMFGDK